MISVHLCISSLLSVTVQPKHACTRLFSNDNGLVLRECPCNNSCPRFGIWIWHLMALRHGHVTYFSLLRVKTIPTKQHEFFQHVLPSLTCTFKSENYLHKPTPILPTCFVPTNQLEFFKHVFVLIHMHLGKISKRSPNIELLQVNLAWLFIWLSYRKQSCTLLV